MNETQIQAWLDQEDTLVAQTIRKHGLCIQHVGGSPGETPPAFAYTIGLFGMGHPELVVAGMHPSTANRLLNTLSERIKAGEDLVVGQMLSFDDWAHRVVVEDLPNPGEIVFAANRHYVRPDEFSVPAYQLTWDDKAGRFPWDDNYATPPHVQPRPGMWTA